MSAVSSSTLNSERKCAKLLFISRFRRQLVAVSYCYCPLLISKFVNVSDSAHDVNTKTRRQRNAFIDVCYEAAHAFSQLTPLHCETSW